LVHEDGGEFTILKKSYRISSPEVQHYCTYFDHHFLPQGLALYQSLCEHAGAFRLHVLALTEECERHLQAIGFDRLDVISLRRLLSHRPALRQARKNRTVIEFYFTCTASLITYLLEKRLPGEAITYLDADCFFFASPIIVHDMEKSASIAITPHRFPARIGNREMYGRFNVGWVTFRRDGNGLACAEDWERRCLEWCFDRLEGERFGDQKYLDAWPEAFRGLKVLNHPGINCAPWNVENASIRLEPDGIRINGEPLVFYHFHGFKWVADRQFEANLGEFIRRSPHNLQIIYSSYLECLLGLRQKYLPHYRPGRIRRVYETRKNPDPSFLAWFKPGLSFSEKNRWLPAFSHRVHLKF